MDFIYVHLTPVLGFLPNEAIWACINGKLKQGKLSVEALRAVSERIDKKVAIFVEDVLPKSGWVQSLERSLVRATCKWKCTLWQGMGML